MHAHCWSCAYGCNKHVLPRMSYVHEGLQCRPAPLYTQGSCRQLLCGLSASHSLGHQWPCPASCYIYLVQEPQ